MTYTYAILEVSHACWDEIAGKLRDADYHHAFHEDGTVIDMHGIALQAVVPVCTCRHDSGMSTECSVHHPKPSPLLILVEKIENLPVTTWTCPDGEHQVHLCASLPNVSQTAVRLVAGAMREALK